jgi:uncharacterized protein (DUF1501 family)
MITPAFAERADDANDVQGRGLSRRRFLTLGAAGTGGVLLSPYLSNLQAFAAPALKSTDGIVVTITLDGGNDGLNTLCPVGRGRYHDLRPTIAVAEKDALMVGKYVGLHPSLKYVKSQFDRGRVAIVQGVGYANADLSHFESMDHWMRGWGGAGSPATGWLGRWVDRLPNAQQESLYAVAIDNALPMHLSGRVSRASGLPLRISDAFGMDRDDASDRRMYAAAKAFGATASGLGTWGNAYGDALEQLMGLTVKIGPAYGFAAPKAYIGQQLALCAHLINAKLGIRVLDVHLGGFDTHADQPTWHAQLLRELDAGIQAFYKALDPSWRDQVVLMTFSEFGRRPEENGDRGTDHGTANVCFVIGFNVNGGLHGAYPSLQALDQYGNLKPSVDFRQVYATVLRRWLRADAREIVGRKYSALDLFRRGPGS